MRKALIREDPGYVRECSIPNITGTIEVIPIIHNQAAGALSAELSSLSGENAAAGPGWGKRKLIFNASKSNDIYSANSLQPRAVQILIIIKA